MKKIISLLCALSVICGVSSVSFADETRGTLSLNVLGYYDETWENEKEAVDAAGDIVMLSINASDISDMSKIGTACNEFSALSFVIEYDKDAIKPYMDTVYESTVFAAKYKAPNKKVPTSDTEGVITTGSIGFITNTAEPGYEPDGKTSMIVNDASGDAGFAVNGDFMTFYFEVVDPSKAGDITLTVDTIDFFDTAAGKLTPAAVNGVSVDGMGAGTDEPAGPTVVEGVADTADLETSTIDGSKYTAVTATFIGDKYDAITFNFEDSLNGIGSYVWNLKNEDLPSINSNMVFGLNITNIPADVATFTCTGVTATVAE